MHMLQIDVLRVGIRDLVGHKLLTQNSATHDTD